MTENPSERRVALFEARREVVSERLLQKHPQV
jgi:hypothetical protein